MFCCSKVSRDVDQNDHIFGSQVLQESHAYSCFNMRLCVQYCCVEVIEAFVCNGMH